MIDPIDKPHDPQELVDQRDFLDSIDRKNSDVMFKLRKDGSYAAVTYKKLVKELYRRKPLLRWGEFYKLIQCLDEKMLAEIVNNYIYFRKP